MVNEFIFVYGTLRKETATPMHQLLARYCEYVSDALLQGKLYEVDGYPGAIESDDPNDLIQGELYRIISTENLLPQLDEYEECTEQFPQPHEYVRKKLLFSLSGSEKVCAWVYVYNLDVTGLVQIKNGDYLCYLQAIKENGPNKTN